MRILADIKGIKEDKHILEDYHYMEYNDYIFIDTYSTDYSMNIKIDKKSYILTLVSGIEDCDTLAYDMIKLIEYMFDKLLIFYGREKI